MVKISEFDKKFKLVELDEFINVELIQFKK